MPARLHVLPTPGLGFVGTRLQTWFPFNIQIWLNGREWLAHQLERRGDTAFRRLDKCFTWLGNPARAQRLMDQQLATAWPRALDLLARAVNPLHAEIFKPWLSLRRLLPMLVVVGGGTLTSQSLRRRFRWNEACFVHVGCHRAMPGMTMADPAVSTAFSARLLTTMISRRPGSRDLARSLATGTPVALQQSGFRLVSRRDRVGGCRMRMGSSCN